MIQILQLILYELDSDSESTGLNFESLPVRLNTLSNIKKKAPIPKFSFTHTINYKYPCSVCIGPCVREMAMIVYVVHNAMSGFIESVLTLLWINPKHIALQIILETHFTVSIVFLVIALDKIKKIKSA